MHHFEYVGDELHCEKVPLEKIAREVGSPVYVYSQATIERHFRVFDEALAGQKHLVCYSLKSNSNLSVVRLLGSLGAGVDTVSIGEIFRARTAGIDANKIVFSGVGKRDDEIEYALREKILLFNVESIPELHAIERVAARMNVRAPVALRINPDVDAQTHPYISTGLKKNKFGIPMSRARQGFATAKSLPHLDVIGLDCHIGSQLTKTTPFKDAMARLAQLANELRTDGVNLRYLDIGGGLGISYNDEQPPTPEEYGTAIKDAIAAFGAAATGGLTLICEPGRVIVGNAGVLVTKTLYVKRGEVKEFVIVDAAMNDLIRPTLYDSFHAIWPVRKQTGAKSFTADVVGPICETGDFFARDRQLAHEPKAGELLAIMSAGAYGFTMASNYNTRPRAAEVMVSGDNYRVIRKRETLEQLIANEV